jgi:hypothetical protein
VVPSNVPEFSTVDNFRRASTPSDDVLRVSYDLIYQPWQFFDKQLAVCEKPDKKPRDHRFLTGALFTNLTGADDTLHAEVARQRQGLLDFYAAGIAAYKGDRKQWSESMQRALAEDDNNAYYSWLAGERK